MKLVSNAGQWHKKWSTWLGLLAASSAGALGVYAMAPERAQNLVPDWALGILIGIGIVAGFAVPFAAAIAQPKITKE